MTVQYTALGSEFLVNSTTLSDQYSPMITGLANGGFVVSWMDDSGLGGDSNSSGIKAQIYGADGTAVGAEFLVNSATLNTQHEPTITSLANGGFVVSWMDWSGQGGDASGSGIKAQIYAADGTAVGAEFLVNSATLNTQQEPTITGLANGGFVVSWMDFSGQGGDASGSGIKAQIYAADGSAVGAEFLVNTQTLSTQQLPTITGLANGGFVVSWMDYSGQDGDTNGSSIKAQIYAADGAAVGSEFLVNSTTFSFQQFPTISGLANGGFVVCWMDNSYIGGDASNFGIKAQIYAADGSAVGGEFLVNSTTLSDQYFPAITGLADGGFVVSWQDYSGVGGDDSGTSIKAQFFDSVGSKVGAEFLVNTKIGADQYTPAITQLTNGSVVIAWADTAYAGDAGDTSGLGIKAQIYELVPNAAPTDILLSHAAVNEFAHSGAAIGTVSAVDGDDAAGFTYALIDDAGGRFALDSTTGLLTVANGGLLDFETATAHQIRVQAIDSSGLSFEKILSIDITNIAEGDRVQKVGGEFLVNSIAQGDQFLPNLVGLSDGSFVATWTDNSGSGGDSSVWAVKGQRFDALGAMLGSEFLVNSITIDAQGYPKAVSMPDGGFVVTWHSLGIDGNSWGVSGQRYDSAAHPIGGEFRVNTSTSDAQYFPSIAGLSDGGFVVTWSDSSLSGGDASFTAIKSQRFDASANAVGGETLINSQVAGYQDYPSVSGLAGGGYVVTWRTSDAAQDGDGTAIKAAIVDEAGAVMPEFLVNSQYVSDQHEPVVAGLHNGGFIIVWRTNDTTQDGNGLAIKAQLYDATGTTIGSEFLVNTDTASEQVDPTVAVLQSGEILVTWYSDDTSKDGSSSSIRGQLLSENGAKLGTEFAVNTEGAGGQYDPAIGIMADGGFAVAWLTADPAQDGSGNAVKAQIFTLAENTAPTDIVATPGPFAIYENGVSGRLAATLSAFDADLTGSVNEQITFSLVDDPSNGGFVLDGDRLLVADGSKLDFETMPVAHLTVRATDAAGATFDKVIDVAITDIAEGDRVQKVGGEFLVNTHTQSGQYSPTITGLANGGFVVSWTTIDPAQDGSGSAIKAKLFDANGTEVGSEFLINTTTQLHQSNPKVTSLANGGFVIAWDDGSLLGTTFDRVDIRAQIFDVSGAAVGGEFLVNTARAEDQQYADITGLANGGFVVSWFTSDPAQDGSNSAIKAQVFHADGTTVGSELRVNSQTANSQYNPTITSLANGGFVISWETYDPAQDGSGSAIKAQIYAADGTIVGSELLVNSQTIAGQYQPTITGLANGNIIVSWYTDDLTQDGSGSAIKAQLLDETGVKIGSEFVVNSSVLSYQEIPRITSLADGGFVVTWQTYNENFEDIDIKAQLFDANGTKLGNEFLVNTDTAAYQFVPTVTGLTNGDFVISWQTWDTAQDGSVSGIKAQIFSLGGEHATTDIILANGPGPIEEGLSTGREVGTLSATDADVNDAKQLSIISDPTNGAFALNGDKLMVADADKLDYETAPVVNLTIRATDQNGNSFDKV